MLLIVAAPRAKNPIIFFIVILLKIYGAVQVPAVRGGGNGGRTRRPSPSTTTGENKGSAACAGAAATPCKRNILAGAQADRHAGPVIGQAACRWSQHALAALAAGQAAAGAAADPVAAITSSSAARMERKSGMTCIRSPFRGGYSAIGAARRSDRGRTEFSAVLYDVAAIAWRR